MQTITLRSRVGTDGVLHLDIPSNYAEAELEVTVTVRPVPVLNNGLSTSWPPEFFKSVIGAWKGEPLVRELGSPYEFREEF